jgi:hypothetical protein
VALKPFVKLEKYKGKIMRSYLIPVLLAFLLLIGCSGEGYIEVKNETPTTILVSVNNLADEIVLPGDTSQTYSVPVMKGVVNNISVDATGEWVGDYSGTVALTDGATILHRISSQLADLTIENGSVDSMSCTIENYEAIVFEGDDTENGKFNVDGDVLVESAGRYKFLLSENMAWLPGFSYTYELVPDACEIQLNNVHSNRVIYYVYLSKSTDQSWGDDQLGDDIVEPGYGYVWKAEGDVLWDVKVEASDPHADSAMFVYEYYDVDPGCLSDVTWIYEFPTIFTPEAATSSSKTDGPSNNVMKTNSLNKVFDGNLIPARIEKIRKIDAGKAGLKALRK